MHAANVSFSIVTNVTQSAIVASDIESEEGESEPVGKGRKRRVTIHSPKSAMKRKGATTASSSSSSTTSPYSTAPSSGLSSTLSSPLVSDSDFEKFQPGEYWFMCAQSKGSNCDKRDSLFSFSGRSQRTPKRTPVKISQEAVRKAVTPKKQFAQKKVYVPPAERDLKTVKILPEQFDNFFSKR